MISDVLNANKMKGHVLMIIMKKMLHFNMGQIHLISDWEQQVPPVSGHIWVTSWAHAEMRAAHDFILIYLQFSL